MKKRLSNDWTPELSGQQEDQFLERALRQKIDADYRKKWQQQLSERGITRKGEGRVVTMKSRRRYLSLAAALVILLVAGWWFTTQDNGAANQQLADRYLQETADQIAQVRMGSETGEVEELWASGRELYTRKQFAEAVESLEGLAQLHPLTVEQSFLLAMSYWQKTPPDYGKVLQYLTTAEQANEVDRTDVYREELAWVEALVFYKKGEGEKAEAAFKQIVDEGGWYAEKAASFSNNSK